MKLAPASTILALLGLFGTVAPAARRAHAQGVDAAPRAKLSRARTPSPDSPPALRGTVFDINGAVIPGARVRLTREGRKEAKAKVWETETDPDGLFSLADLRRCWDVRPLEPGLYTLTIESPGFRKFRRNWLKLEAGEDVTLDVTLAVAEPHGLTPAALR